MTHRPQRYFIGILSVLVLSAVVVGLWANGSPAHIRRIRLDEMRVNGMNFLAQQLNLKKPTMNDLSEAYNNLNFSGNWNAPGRDPETGERYEFVPGQDGTYQLCAVFSEPTPVPAREEGPTIPSVVGLEVGGRTHGSGRQCFTYKILKQN